jgi:hypothetical protein
MLAIQRSVTVAVVTVIAAIAPPGQASTTVPAATEHVVADPLSPTLQPPTRHDLKTQVYVVNAGSRSVTVYQTGSGGNVAPKRVLAGRATLLIGPNGIALDVRRRIYVSNYTSLRVGTKSSVTVFSADATGDAAPIQNISGAKTNLVESRGIAVDPNGAMYVANEGAPDRGGPSVTVFTSGSTGNVTPVRTVSGSNTGLGFPGALALDAAQRLYVANSTASFSNLLVYASDANGNVAPIETVLTGSFPVGGGIAVDGSGNMYTGSANCGSSSCVPDLLVYAAGASGFAQPIQDISGSNTGLSQGPVTSLAVDAARNIYVVSAADDTISVFAAGATGNVAPIVTIHGSKTMLDDPCAIAIH